MKISIENYRILVFLFLLFCFPMDYMHISKASSNEVAWNFQSSSPVFLGEPKSVSKEISTGQKDIYQVDLPSPNFFAFLEIEQKDIAINVKVYKKGKELITTLPYNKLHGDFNPIYLSSVEANSYYIEISLPEELEKPAKGSYSISLVELHAKTFQDERKLEAYENSSKADELDSLESSINFYTNALKIYQSLGLEKGKGAIFFAMANTYKSQANYEEATKYYQNAIDLSEKSGFIRLEGRSLSSLGVIYKLQGEYQKALDFFQKALAKNEMALDNDGISQTLGNIGATYTALGEYEKSINHFEKQLNLCQKMLNYEHIAGLYNNIAVSKVRLNDYPAALQYLEKALNLSEKINFLYGQGTYLSNIGKIYEKLKDYRKSIEYYQKSAAIHKKTGDHETEAIMLSNMGMAYKQLSEPEKAIECYNEALKMHRSLNLQRDAAVTLQRIAQLQKEQNKLVDAKNSMEAALNIIEIIQKNILVGDLRISNFSSTYEFYNDYIDTLMLLHSQNPSIGYNAQAFEVNEKVHGRSLLELLAQNSINPTLKINNDLIEQEREIRNKINQKAEELFKSKLTLEKSKLIEKDIQELEIEIQKVESKINEQNPTYASLINPKTLTLKEVQDKVLDDNTVLLEYSLGRERSYLWVISKNAMRSFEIGPSNNINELSQDIHKGISQFFSEARFERDQNKILEILEQNNKQIHNKILALSKNILAPASSLLLPGKKLLIVPDGKLNYIPFSTIIKQEESNITNKGERLLLEDHEITNIVSASTLFSQRMYLNQDKQKHEITLIGDPVFSLDDERIKPEISLIKKRETSISKTRNSIDNIEDLLLDTGIDRSVSLSRLPFSGREILSIKSFIKDEKPNVFTDFQANRNNIINDTLKESKFIHFATHALTAKNPKTSGIIFSLVNEEGKEIDGFLSFEQILTLNLKADMVTLSACQTALGKEVEGEGLISLGRAFAYAGAKRTIITLWKVDDEATSEFMTKFYEKLLKENMSPSTALREAQIYMLKNPKWRLPYFWAGFVIEGEPN